MPVQRFSSRQQRLDASFLAPRLSGAQAYDRIAGYFRSSILEVAGEALESVAGVVRVVCNSDLDPADVASAKAANEAMRREWCAATPEKLAESERGRDRFACLYQLLAARKLQVRVLPNERFGFIHGKAGVITQADGRQTAFLGSVNESYTAWRVNYELLWEDDSAEAVRWVQDEFDALWDSPVSIPLSSAIVEDIERLSRRSVIRSVPEWRSEPVTAAPLIEAPVYRREAGLWEHQKYFVDLAFRMHRGLQGRHGARFVLADQVGLGKTLQLAMAAELMALIGDKPVLILAPKPLVWQWQDELHTMLDMPSAVWDGRQWVDENDIVYPNRGPIAIRDCPRWVGIVSTGLITRRSEVADILADMDFECVILDEAHRARRRHLTSGQEYERAEPNNLLKFMQDISSHTKSLLLATATPVQLHPVEAWDLLDALNRGDGAVLGRIGSPWLDAEAALTLVTGDAPLPTDELKMWDWLRDPFPPASEGLDYAVLRRSLNLDDETTVVPGNAFDRLRPPDRTRMRNAFKDHIQNHNPFIRHIVRRTREFLENTINPDNNEPYLKPVKVMLHGERDQDAILLPPFLSDAYAQAEEFCDLLKERSAGNGFLRTLLLRRVGSTMEAGRLTAERMLRNWAETVDLEESDNDAMDEDNETTATVASSLILEAAERDALQRFIRMLEANQARDPKYIVVKRLLQEQGWLGLGCIIFSQYFDSVWWLANQLSAELPNEKIGIYAGAQKSGLMEAGLFNAVSREDIKTMARQHEMRLLLGTDAASEGLNLQYFGTLINLDLPWNPTRLEQRKGRIQRIGQVRDTVDVYNMRYAGSVEDQVHSILSERLQSITALFGQLPDVLEDVWVQVAQGENERAKQIIDNVPERHPFDLRYNRITHVNWESCATVLNAISRKQYLSRGWRK
jgi:PLD-like domain/Helicase conserved C-terminal domain/SNF2-related domain